MTELIHKGPSSESMPMTAMTAAAAAAAAAGPLNVPGLCLPPLSSRRPQ